MFIVLLIGISIIIDHRAKVLLDIFRSVSVIKIFISVYDIAKTLTLFKCRFSVGNDSDELLEVFVQLVEGLLHLLDIITYVIKTFFS